MRFDPSSAAFRLTYLDNGRGQMTQLYLNQAIHYPRGFVVHVLNGTANHSSSNSVHVWAGKSGMGFPAFTANAGEALQPIEELLPIQQELALLDGAGAELNIQRKVQGGMIDGPLDDVTDNREEKLAASVAPPPAPPLQWGAPILEPTDMVNTVDVAVAPRYSGAKSGHFKSADGDIIAWNVLSGEEVATGGFTLSTASNITWWKAFKIVADDGTELCVLQMQDGDHGPKTCLLSGGNSHAFLFDYRIEVWKAKRFGKHTHVDTIQADTFGPLLLTQIQFTWLHDD